MGEPRYWRPTFGETSAATGVLGLAVILGFIISVNPWYGVAVAGGSTAVWLCLTAWLSDDPSMRLGIILAFFVSNIAYWLSLPAGIFAVLVSLFVVRDVRIIFGGRRANYLWLLIGTFGFLVALSPTRFGLGVAAGLLLYWYLTGAKPLVNYERLALFTAFGGVVGAAFSLWRGNQDYLTYVGGTLVSVRRAVGTGLDANASASLLLIAAGAALLLLSSAASSRVRRLAAAGATALIAVGLTATGSRAALLGLLIILGGGFLTRQRTARVAHRLAASRTIAIAGPLMLCIVYVVLTASELDSRLAGLGIASSTRMTLWTNALEATLQDPGTVLIGIGPGPSGSITSALAPHNSVLELLVTYGGVGVVVITATVLAAGRPTRATPLILRATGLAVLLQSMTIGGSGQFLPWVGLALMVGRRHRGLQDRNDPVL